MSYLIKCDDCKATIRETDQLTESVAGGTCPSCADRHEYIAWKAEVQRLNGDRYISAEYWEGAEDAWFANKRHRVVFNGKEVMSWPATR